MHVIKRGNYLWIALPIGRRPQKTAQVLAKDRPAVPVPYRPE
jgi:hypothetical protein